MTKNIHNEVFKIINHTKQKNPNVLIVNPWLPYKVWLLGCVRVLNIQYRMASLKQSDDMS